MILGRYDSLEALSAAVPAPGVGDAYSVGMAAPYDVRIWDGAQWVNNGKLQGAAGADGATFTPSVSAEGVLSWENDGGRENPAAVNLRGPQGPAGTDGAAGPNRVTTATATTLTGLLKGSGGTVQAAAAGTDYVAPVSGTAGNVVVFGAGGALADSGYAVGETGGGGWKVVCKSLPISSTSSIASGTDFTISPGISLSGDRVIEFELEVFGLTQGSVLNALIVNSSSEQIGFMAAVSPTNSAASHMVSRCWINTGSKRSITYYEDGTSVQTTAVSYQAAQSEISKITFTSTGTNAFLALVVRYRIWDDPGV